MPIKRYYLLPVAPGAARLYTSRMPKRLLVFCLFLLSSLSLAQTTRAEKLVEVLHDPTSSYVFVVAHRGGWEHDWENRAPENSLANIDKAVKMDFDVFETDLAQTADGHIVVMHDLTVDRTTNGVGAVTELTLAQLKALRLRYTNGELSDETVPTFEEFLQRAQKRILFKIDYRAPLGTFPEAVRLVEKYEMLDQVFFRFDAADEETVQTLAGFVEDGMPYTPTLLLFRMRTPQEVRSLLEAFDLAIIEVFFEENELTDEGRDAVRVAEDAGLLVETHEWGSRWWTGRDAWRKLLETGVRMVHTRNPEAFTRYLERRGLHALP